MQRSKVYSTRALIEGAGVSMNDNPLVSVVVRTKDRPKLLRKAIQSISTQIYRPIEVVLVNDGGCDLNLEDLQGILENISLNYLKLETNTGRAGAGNAGIGSAHGKYVGFLDDDDEYYPEHLTTLVSFLEQSDYEVAYTDSLMVYKEYSTQPHEMNDSVKREVVFSQDFNYDKLVFENYIPFMCLLFKRDRLVASGGFDNGFELYEDWDLLIRIGKNHPFYHIKQVTADYNQWSIDLQISQRNRDPVFMQQAYMKVISRHIGEITPKRIHGIISEVACTRQRLRDLKNELESQNNLMRDQSAQIEALSVQVREGDAQVSFLRGQLNDRVVHIETLSAQMKERDARINALSSEVEAKVSRIDELEGELRDRAAQIEALLTEVRERDAQVISLEGQMRDRAVQIEALSVQVRERDAQVSFLRGQLSEQAAQIETLSARMEERDARINALSSEVEAKVSRIGELESELRECNARLSGLISSIAGKEEDIISLQGALKDREALIMLMENTRGWQILEKYRKVRDRFIAPLFGIRRENTEK
jgi:glycosyltransferase involved in cell wall biosynthesis/predicted  nucleic acid-binding Zn-ribbon protein